MIDKKNDVKTISPSPAPTRKEIYKAQSTHDQGRSLADTPKGHSQQPSTPSPTQTSSSNKKGSASKKD